MVLWRKDGESNIGFSFYVHIFSRGGRQTCAQRLRLLGKIISRRNGKSNHLGLYFYTFFFLINFKSRLQFIVSLTSIIILAEMSSFFIVTKIIMFHIISITHRLGYGDEKSKLKRHPFRMIYGSVFGKSMTILCYAFFSSSMSLCM